MADAPVEDEGGDGGAPSPAPPPKIDIRAIQARMLAGKALVMKSLGLDELHERFDAVVSSSTSAAKAARKRKISSPAPAEAAPVVRRRSSRCVVQRLRASAPFPIHARHP